MAGADARCRGEGAYAGGCQVALMSVTLTAEEERALRTALDNYLPELKFELARVKLERTRHELVILEETLTRLRNKLQEQRP